MTRFLHLGEYSDWADGVLAALGDPPPAAQVRSWVRDLLDVPEEERPPADVRMERRWERDGLVGEELSWSVGYGPRTRAWLLRPVAQRGPLPGVLALHGHDGFKFFGKEKVADGPEPPYPAVAALRATHYEGRAFANELARAGFVVLVPDVFGWGSRRFPLSEMPPLLRRLAKATRGIAPPDELPDDPSGEIAVYNAAAWHHEHLLAKYCTLFGTTMAAAVAAEDRAALGYLRSRSEVADRIGCIGLSGGGCRSALLTATAGSVAAAVIVGMMSTYDALIDHNVIDHTWMFFPAGLTSFADWPDLAACHAPTPLMVQYNRDDHLFPLDGAERAHERITAHYRSGGYDGRFYPGPHKFDLAMQRDAFAWLSEHLTA